MLATYEWNVFWFAKPKRNLGKKVSIWLSDNSPSSGEVEAGRPENQNLEAGTEAGTMEGCCLLTCSSWLLHLAFLHTQDQRPGVAPPREGWGFPHHHRSETCHTDLQPSNVMEAFSQLKILFPDNSSLCQDDEILTRTRWNLETLEVRSPNILIPSSAKWIIVLHRTETTLVWLPRVLGDEGWWENVLPLEMTKCYQFK